MKIRQGFISNSSSSSFVVLYKDWDNNILLDKIDKEKLINYGFWQSSGYYPDQIKRDDDPSFSSYAYGVNCNEDEVLDFLIKEDISFRANCHYDHYTVIYEKGSDKIISLKNFGVWWLMYAKFQKRFGKTIEESNTKGIKIIDKNKFLIGEDYYSF